MKTNIYTGLALLIGCILLFSACALGFEPAWKSKPTSIAFQLSTPELPASPSYARAIAQGGGYLYLRTLGGPTGNGSFYGPYQVGAGGAFETTDIPPGTYTGIGVLFSPAPLETKTGAYGGVLTPFATLMNLPDTEFNAFTSNGDTSAFNAMLDGDASGFMLKDVVLKQGTVNSFKLTLEPMTGPASTVDASVLPTIALTSPSPASLVRKFIKVKNINPTPGYVITDLVATVSATGSPTLGTAALYDGQGQLIQAFPVPATNPIAASEEYSVPYATGDYYNFYIEYKAANLTIACSKVEVAAPTHNVTFDKNSVSATGSMPSQPIPEGSSAPLMTNSFTRPGWFFEGWATSPGGALVYPGGASFMMGTADVTLYALWTTSVNFDSQGGTTVLPASVMTPAVSLGTLPAPPTRVGYDFAGWSTGINTGTEFTGATPVTGNETVYAMWSTTGLAYTLINGNTEYSVSKGSANTAGIVEIPCYWQGKKVAAIGSSAFANCATMTGIVIPAGVTMIADQAFYHCDALASITIPAGVTTIYAAAFQYCGALTNVVIPAGVTTIGNQAFAYDGNLTSISIPASVTSFGDWVFGYCTSLITLTIPPGVTTIGASAFTGMTSLTTLTIPAGIVSIGNSAFSDCTALTSVFVNPLTPPLGGTTMFLNCTLVANFIRVPAGSVGTYQAAVNWIGYATYIGSQ